MEQLTLFGESPTVEEDISQFLINGYIYYVLGTNVISDKEFDDICKRLLDKYELVESSEHPHKHYITKERLEATSLYDVIKWPRVVKHCAKLDVIKRRKNDGFDT